MDLFGEARGPAKDLLIVDGLVRGCPWPNKGFASVRWTRSEMSVARHETCFFLLDSSRDVRGPTKVSRLCDGVGWVCLEPGKIFASVSWTSPRISMTQLRSSLFLMDSSGASMAQWLAAAKLCGGSMCVAMGATSSAESTMSRGGASS